MELFYSALREGSTILLKGGEAEHCAKVLRHKIGETVFVIDGAGGLYRCTIENIATEGERAKRGKKGGGWEVVCHIEEESQGIGKRRYQLTMAVCPTKNNERYEWFVEKATEFGVDRIIPIISDHSIRNTVKRERLEAVALSATKQSLKACLPIVEEPISVMDFLRNSATTMEASSESDSATFQLKLIAYCEEIEEKKSIRQRIEELKGSAAAKKSSGSLLVQPPLINFTIMIGPEGDFSKREIELALRNGFLPTTLGPSRLRVETAAIAAVSEIYFSQEVSPIPLF